jgi:hypothetical protein
MKDYWSSVKVYKKMMVWCKYSHSYAMQFEGLTCPSISMGRRGGAVCSFSAKVSIFWFIKMASPKLNGAGMPEERRAIGSI